MRLRLTYDGSKLLLNGIAVYCESSGILTRTTAKKLVEAGHLQEHLWLAGQPSRTPHVKQCEICSAYFIGPPKSKACSVDCSIIVTSRREAVQRQDRRNKIDHRSRTNCAICKKPMESIRKSKMTCSAKCRQAAYRRWVKS